MDSVVPVQEIRTAMIYAMRRYPGAIAHPFLQLDALKALNRANEYIRDHSGGRYQLLIWDALRSFETQQYLYERERARISDEHPDMSSAELDTYVAQFVRPPSRIHIPPHCTGGAVDVSLHHDGQPLNLGDFDDFSPFGAATYFEHHHPTSDRECEVMALRELLTDGMKASGYIGIDNEWWHFEIFTRLWANRIGAEPLFDSICHAPAVHGDATRPRYFPNRQPTLETGVAPVFASNQQRADALAHRENGFYYVRSSHPTHNNLQRQLSQLTDANSTWTLVPTGLSAVATAVAALMPPGGTLVLDTHIYYESATTLHVYARRFGWQIIRADLSSPDEIRKLQHANVIFLDSPRNWYLDVLPCKAISKQAHLIGAKTIADVSVQPVQNLFSLDVDVVVQSLSKYPSSGLTCGGAIGATDNTIATLIDREAKLHGLTMAPDTALVIGEQICSLPDRMQALSEKALKVADMLRSNPYVRLVRVPDGTKMGGLVGGQVCFHADTAERAAAMEEVVSHNSMSRNFPLALACTFGAVFTTFEHFASNLRHREVRVVEDLTEGEMPRDIVRIGIGYESLKTILDALHFVIHTTRYSPA